MELPISSVMRPHRNHGLFSDHYLNVTLPERPDWAGAMHPNEYLSNTTISSDTLYSYRGGAGQSVAL
jgi:hypothetical protein